jgi:HSP20 family protein
MALATITPFQRKNTGLANSGSLLTGWDDFHRDMDRLFDSFFGSGTGATGSLPARSTASTVQPLLMTLDVSETDGAYTIHADLPGLEQKDVEVTLAEGILTLRAERKQQEKQEGKTWHRSERSYGSVQRTLQLPADADENKVEATMKNGVLEIEIGKTEKAQPVSKKIEIKSA